MRILWLKAGGLLPLDTGGNLRTWHLMRQLAARHEITFLSFGRQGLTSANVERMRDVAAHVETIPRREPARHSLRFYAEVALHLVDPLPYAIGKYRSRAFRARVERVLASEPFDLIVCDFLPPALNLPRSLPCPAVLFTHNVEAEIWRRHVETATTTLSRWLYRMQHRRMLRFEERTLRRFQGVLTVSESDALTFARLYPTALAGAVQVVATGVDTAFFAEAGGEAPEHPRHLVFTGSMDWLPNEDAMRYFCREILPLIRAKEPGVTLSIVGRAPTPAVRALAACPGVTVTGRVDDVRPFVRDAAVYIVPLRVGGGTRLKIFEAMAMGKAVVSTAVGAEGLPVVDGTHLILADEPAAFADAVVALVRDPERCRELGAASRALVVEHHDWAAVAVPFERFLVRFAAPPPARPADDLTPMGVVAPALAQASRWPGAPAPRAQE